MAEQSKFGALLKQAKGKFDVAGVPVGDIVSTVASVFKRKPNVKAWAKAKRQFKRSLKADGLSGSELRQRLITWQQNNPKPQGSEPYNPMDLGVSNQMNPNAQAIVPNGDTGAGSNASGQVMKSGLGFNPLFLLLALPFVFPKPFKNLRKQLNI
mgnify:FL=1|tara:strand:- start:151 stop:612 length:462 start_codon:yes stop_codon:yes gene_type:complete